MQNIRLPACDVFIIFVRLPRLYNARAANFFGYAICAEDQKYANNWFQDSNGSRVWIIANLQSHSVGIQIDHFNIAIDNGISEYIVLIHSIVYKAGYSK